VGSFGQRQSLNPKAVSNPPRYGKALRRDDVPSGREIQNLCGQATEDDEVMSTGADDVPPGEREIDGPVAGKEEINGVVQF